MHTNIDEMITAASQPDAKPESFHGGITFGTPNGVTLFALIQLRACLRLEAAGMRRRGVSALSQAKRLGLKARTAADAYNTLTSKMDAAGLIRGAR